MPNYSTIPDDPQNEASGAGNDDESSKSDLSSSSSKSDLSSSSSKSSLSSSSSLSSLSSSLDSRFRRGRGDTSEREKKMREELRQSVLELEGPRRAVGPQIVQVRPVCGRAGGGPQRLVARRPRFVTYEIAPGYRGESVVAMWHTARNEENAASDKAKGKRSRFLWASLDEQPDVTVAVRYLRGPESLGEVPAEERPLFDRERYKVEVRPGQPDPTSDPSSTGGNAAKTRALLYYRGEPMHTEHGEGGEYIFVMSAEGDLYAADVHRENVVEGPGVYLRALEAAAEALLAEGWNFKAAKRVPPVVRRKPAPAQPVTCGLQALDQDGACEGRVRGSEDGCFIPGVTTSTTAPTGFEPADGKEGVAYFADLPEGGAWVCRPCFDRRGHERCKVRWPVIVRPDIDLAEVRRTVESNGAQANYPCILDAIDVYWSSKYRAATELRAAAAQRVAEQSDGSPRRMLLLHHSSFLAGAPVACAGTLKVNQGVLEKITNDSGHYSPPRPLLVQVVARLVELGVDVLRLTIVPYMSQHFSVGAGWEALRRGLGSVDDPDAMQRGHGGPPEEIRAKLHRELRDAVHVARSSGRLYARRPDAAPAPCATSGCAGDGTCVAIDEVGETFLCRSCLDVRLLGRCERPGCQEPATHEVLAADLDGAWERGGRERNRNAKGKLAKEGDVDVQVRVGLCTQHFRERLTIHCAEPGCTRTSEQGVMDAISNSFFCKEHFTMSLESQGLQVCQDPDCTEFQEVAQVGDRWLCRDHQA